MGMRYQFSLTGDIKLSGVMAEGCINLGYWETKDPILDLSYSQVFTLCDYMRIQLEVADSPLERFKYGVLIVWLKTHELDETLTFA